MIPVAGSIQSTGLCLYGVARPDAPLRLQRIAIPASRLGLPSWMRIIRIRALRERAAPELPSAYLAGSASCSYVLAVKLRAKRHERCSQSGVR